MIDRENLIGVDTVRTLAHVALMAASEGYVPAAERILNALDLARPKEPSLKVCRAMLLARQEKFAECLGLLKGLTREYPENQTIKSILGFMMFTTGEVGWKPLLTAVIEDGSDSASMELARMILEESDEPQNSTTDRQAGVSEAVVEGRRFISYA